MTRRAFTIPGQPVGKKRPRTFLQGGKVITTTPPETREYEKRVLLCAKAAGVCREATAKPLSVTVRAFMGDARRRDLDNVIKSITDALNGHAFNDDTQIVELHGSKSIDRENPRAEVEIVEIDRGCMACEAGSMNHVDPCGCRCHAANRRGDE